MDAAGVDAFVVLVGDHAQVSVLHDDVARDGVEDLLAVLVPAGGERRRGGVSTCSFSRPFNPLPAHLIFGAHRGLLVPQRNPTTLPRGTILTLRLAGGGVGLARASTGSAAQQRRVEAARVKGQRLGTHRSRGHSAGGSSSS